MKQLVARYSMAILFAAPFSVSAYAADLERPADPTLQTTANIELSVGHTFISNAKGTGGNAFLDNPNSEDYPVFALHARVSAPLADYWSVQTDLDLEITDNFGLPDTNSYHTQVYSGQLGVHLSARDPQRGLVGAFFTGGQAGNCEFSNSPGTCNYRFYATGLEGQVYLDDVTLYGQAGYLDSRSVDDIGLGAGLFDTLHEAWFVRGVARWFLSDQERVQLETSYANGKQDAVTEPNPRPWDMHVLEWIGRYDTTIAGIPVFFGYRGNYYENFSTIEGDDGSYMDHTVFGGVSIFLTPTDRRTADRNSVTLNFPDFGRWVSAGDILDF